MSEVKIKLDLEDKTILYRNEILERTSERLFKEVGTFQVGWEDYVNLVNKVAEEIASTSHFWEHVSKKYNLPEDNQYIVCHLDMTIRELNQGVH